MEIFLRAFIFLSLSLFNLAYAGNPCDKKCVEQIVIKVIKNNSSLKGPKGDTGPQGPTGPAGSSSGSSSSCTLTTGNCYVFKTAVRVLGDMSISGTDYYNVGAHGDGIDGGNAICQAEGDVRFGTGSTWRAWLSDGATSAITNISYFAAKNYTSNAGGETIAAPGQLITASLNFYISLMNDGIWTGTTSAGTAEGNDCNNWTDGMGGSNGRRGITTSLTGQWTSNSVARCNVASSLYCFQATAE